MAENSKIEWTHHTFNPWRGCTKVSPGCKFCYAETLSKRNPKALGEWGPQGTRVVAAESYWRQPVKWNKDAEQAGERRRVFCASLADVFEGPETMPAESWERLIDARGRLWKLIADTPHLDWLLLTKRPENIIHQVVWYAPGCKPPPNVWFGTSVENQEQAEKRIPELLKVPDAIRFLSCEPLLGHVDLSWFFSERGDDGLPTPGVHWVIVGGESGPNARPMHPDWARSIRDQCQTAGVPFFFKQWGEYQPVTPLYAGRDDCAEDGRGDLVSVSSTGHIYSDMDGQPNDVKTWLMERIGKKAAGRLLDGREWNEYPITQSPIASITQ